MAARRPNAPKRSANVLKVGGKRSPFQLSPSAIIYCVCARARARVLTICFSPKPPKLKRAGLCSHEDHTFRPTTNRQNHWNKPRLLFLCTAQLTHSTPQLHPEPPRLPPPPPRRPISPSVWEWLRGATVGIWQLLQFGEPPHAELHSASSALWGWEVSVSRTTQ